MTKQDDKYEWLKFAEFGTKASKFNADKNTIIDEMAIFKADGGADSTPVTKLLAHLNSEFSFFALGPVYTTCGIPFDVFGEFREMMAANGTPYDGPRLVFQFKKPVFKGLREWDYMFEAMHNGPDFERFMQFCTTQCVRVRDSQTYWRIKRHDMVICDPLAVDDNRVTNDTKVVVSILLPSGNKFQVATDKLITMPPYGFRMLSPDAGVVAEATAIFNVKGV